MDTMTMTGKKEKVNFLLPSALYKRANHFAKELNFTLSDLMREALAVYLRELEKEKIAREVEEDCRKNYEFDKKLAAQWASIQAKV